MMGKRTFEKLPFKVSAMNSVLTTLLLANGIGLYQLRNYMISINNHIRSVTQPEFTSVDQLQKSFAYRDFDSPEKDGFRYSVVPPVKFAVTGDSKSIVPAASLDGARSNALLTEPALHSGPEVQAARDAKSAGAAPSPLHSKHHVVSAQQFSVNHITQQPGPLFRMAPEANRVHKSDFQAAFRAVGTQITPDTLEADLMSGETALGQSSATPAGVGDQNLGDQNLGEQAPTPAEGQTATSPSSAPESVSPPTIPETSAPPVAELPAVSSPTDLAQPPSV